MEFRDQHKLYDKLLTSNYVDAYRHMCILSIFVKGSNGKDTLGIIPSYIQASRSFGMQEQKQAGI